VWKSQHSCVARFGPDPLWARVRLRWIVVEKARCAIAAASFGWAATDQLCSGGEQHPHREQRQSREIGCAAGGPSGAANSFLNVLPDVRDARRAICFTLCVKSRGSNISCRGASVE